MFLIRFKIESILKLVAVLILAFPAVSSASTVRMQTVLGNIDIELFDAAAPLTVANFMNYVNRVLITIRLFIAVCLGLSFRVGGTLGIMLA